MASQYHERIAHLDFIQACIRRLDINSFAVKVASLVVTAGSFVAHIVQAAIGGNPGTFALLNIGEVALLFLFWIFDARSQQDRAAYISLHDRARRSEEVTFDMNIEPYKSSHTFSRALWAAPSSWLYIGQIIIVSLLSLMG